MAASFSPYVVGVNMVGAEGGTTAVRDFRLHMNMVKFLRHLFPEVKVSIHAGEFICNASCVRDETNNTHLHIREAVNIARANRIGHAVNVLCDSDPKELLDMLRDRDVAIEINLTSNDIILGIRGERHPFQQLREAGVPIVLSTDDAGVARTDGLTHEFLKLTQHHGTKYADLKNMIYNSISHSFLSEAEKESLIWQLDSRFAQFEEQMAALISMRNPSGLLHDYHWYM